MAKSRAVDPSEVVARNVIRLRKEHGLSQKQLAQRLAKFAGVKVSDTMVRDIEHPGSERATATGKKARGIQVDELLWLAYVLDVSPARLLTTDWEDDDATRIGTARLDPYNLAKWFAGMTPMIGQDRNIFDANAPSYGAVVSSTPVRLDTVASGVSLSVAEFFRALETKNYDDARRLASRLSRDFPAMADALARDEAKPRRSASRDSAGTHRVHKLQRKARKPSESKRNVFAGQRAFSR